MFHSHISRRSLCRRAFLCAAALAGVAASQIAWARPANLDTSLDRLGDRHVFRIAVQSSITPIPMSRLHQWTVHLSDVQGRPVSGAALTIDGGMPEHGHGLPTAPRATAAATPGDYVINGMKFSMTGWWVLKLGVAAPDGRTDRITFNVVL